MGEIKKNLENETNEADVLVTVIIPVYNVEKYLRRCLDSVINQTHKNLEIIVVDDGSTDESGVICDEYLKKDNRLKVIHKENGGLSSARNAALDIASDFGYLAFVDSDDWIAKNAIEILVREMKSSKCDMIVFNFFADNGHEQIFMNTTGDCSFNTAEVKHKLIMDYWLNSVWDKFYKASIYHNIRFPEGKTFEDAYVMLDVLDRCTSIHCIKDALYYYNRENNFSITKEINLRNVFNVYKGWEKKSLNNRLNNEEKNYTLIMAKNFAKKSYYLNHKNKFLTDKEINSIRKLLNIDDEYLFLNKMKGFIEYYKLVFFKILSSNFSIWILWKKYRINR